MEGEKENTNLETQEEFEKEACLPTGRETLSEKALEDDFELDEDLDKLPIWMDFDSEQ